MTIPLLASVTNIGSITSPLGINKTACNFNCTSVTPLSASYTGCFGTFSNNNSAGYFYRAICTTIIPSTYSCTITLCRCMNSPIINNNSSTLLPPITSNTGTTTSSL